MSRDKPTMREAIKEIEKEVGDKVIYSGNALHNRKMARTSTGIFALDLLTGGGIPEGRITIFQGAKGSTKTSTALRTAGIYLRCNPTKHALYVDFEQTYEIKWTKHFIDDFDRWHVATPAYSEMGIDIVSTAMKSDDLGFIIIDSLAQMVPMIDGKRKAIDGEMRGYIARPVTMLIRKMVPILADRIRFNKGITVIFINQQRMNVDGRKFSPETKKPGGVHQDFACTLDIRFSGPVLKYKVHGIPAAKTQHYFTIEKNKLGLHKRSGEFIINLLGTEESQPGEVEDMETIITYARRSNVLARVGNTWVWHNHIFKNLDQVRIHLVDKLELQKMNDETLAACLGDILLTVTDKERDAK